MTRPLREYFADVVASDVQRYDDEHRLHDFLMPGVPSNLPAGWAPDWVFTNPPFKLAREFVTRAMEISQRGVVMFVRGAFTEGDERYRTLFAGPMAPSYVVTYCERVVLLRDRLIRGEALDPFNLVDGKPQRASSATSYALVIWLPGENDTRHRWIPKCRHRLEREGDYPAYAEQWAKIAPATEGTLL